MQWQGRYYFAKKSASSPARCTAEGEWLKVQLEDTRLFEFNAKETSVDARLGSLPRKFRFADGSYFECEDTHEIDAWVQQYSTTTIDHKGHLFENKLRIIAPLALLAVAFLVLFYNHGVPRFSKWAAFQISPKVQQLIGRNTLALLDKIYLEPSSLDNAEKQNLQQAFQALLAHTSNPPTAKLHFRGGGNIGANALAIPNGDIVITDELVALAKGKTIGLQGVLAHELGHLHHRHTLRQVIAASVIPVFLAMTSGGLIDASEIAASIPVVLLEQGYSRDFERESDQYARALLWKMQIDTQPVADLFEKLGQHVAADTEEESGPALFSTHPGFAERIEFFSKKRANP